MSGDISTRRPDGTPYPVQLDDAELAKTLDPLSFQVLRMASTERAGTGEYTDSETEGVYRCKACSAELFRSDTKFHSGCGWPSFYAPVDNAAVVLLTDHLLGYPRTEVRCARCDGHLGHVFADGPKPAGTRYCMNSAALKHVPKMP